jgi:hypothetical protein
MRASISVFVLVLIALAAIGIVWTGRHQPPAQAMASQLVLGTSALSGVVALVAVWRRP